MTNCAFVFMDRQDKVDLDMWIHPESETVRVNWVTRSEFISYRVLHCFYQKYSVVMHVAGQLVDMIGLLNSLYLHQSLTFWVCSYLTRQILLLLLKKKPNKIYYYKKQLILLLQ